ncbi:MAG: GNAT family N-acetyltransferase [Lysobacterales bacterium 14-68-21]|jgi:predicted N-acyltransferase|nr:MAG: GNAT family N-acetyltransferase [Xanthomonadales bacterium 15-68-25]OZB67100.1 MAG: GNAT family N-acetyltransferase [Xanthomonadales bacterium 14-68-21]
MSYLAQLEPESLLRQFLAHPPDGFVAGTTPSGMPTFVAPFDLLTTADDALRQRVMKLPGYARWGRLLRWRTRFVGCTATEFAPLPRGAEPEALAGELVSGYGRDCALMVVKDIATESPLLDVSDNLRAAALAHALEAEGCVLLEGMALAWVPIDFDSEEDYLARLSRSRRKEMKRKLRSRADLRIETWHTGDRAFAVDSVMERFIELYENVYAQSEIHFDHLSADYLRALLCDAGSGGLVFTYFAGDELIGWNLCYEYAGKLVDKYIGLAYPAAREHNLYFVSWMENLEYARSRGLSHYVAGWTDTAVKRQLGARFCITRHAVYVRNPLLRALFRRISHHFESEPVQPAQAMDPA